MAKDRKYPKAQVAIPGAPAPDPVPSPTVRVVARTHIAELIDGEIRRFAPGEAFELPESRAVALGPLVDRA